MASSSGVFLSSEKVDKVLEEILSDSESSFFYSDDDSSGIDDLPVGEAIAIERTEDENSDSEIAVQSVSSSARFTWEDMTNYVGRREQFIGNCGPQNDAKDVTEGADKFKFFFFTQDLVESMKYFVESFITIQQFLRKLYIFEAFSTFRLKFKYPGRKSSHSTVLTRD
jgi:hypothetical protein